MNPTTQVHILVPLGRLKPLAAPRRDPAVAKRRKLARQAKRRGR